MHFVPPAKKTVVPRAKTRLPEFLLGERNTNSENIDAQQSIGKRGEICYVKKKNRGLKNCGTIVSVCPALLGGSPLNLWKFSLNLL